MSKLDVITLDGPAGVGKSTVSRLVAERLSYTLLDTGAMYRAVGILLAEERGIDLNDEDAIRAELAGVEMDMYTTESGDCGVVIAGIDVSGRIRTADTGMLASKVSAIACVREKLTQMQQSIGGRGKVVAEGRDMGTVVFPTAQNKFFLDAAPEVRCARRAHQLRAKGEEVNETELLSQIIIRDKQDRERAIAPLKKADDAHLIDTGLLSRDEVVAKILDLIKS